MLVIDGLASLGCLAKRVSSEYCTAKYRPEGADHPLAVLRDLSAANVHKGLNQAEEEDQGKEGSGGSFVGASDGHCVTHDERESPARTAAGPVP